MIAELVVNGCSYNEVYANGPGPAELAKSLQIEKFRSLALGGSANSRIIRTTLKHSYKTTCPTFYLVGLTFASRWELPILEAWAGREFEGRWVNPKSQRGHHERLQPNWTDKDTETYTELMFKGVTFGQTDQFEDLMYRCLSMAADLQCRGHRILIFDNCNEHFRDLVDHDAKFSFIKNNPIFVNGLRWTAIPWQHTQGAKPSKKEYGDSAPPERFRHIAPEDYQYLNDYLTNYIGQHKILQ